jgi:hypothetical protein
MIDHDMEALFKLSYIGQQKMGTKEIKSMDVR